MQILKLFLLIIIIFVSHYAAKEIEIECEVSQEHLSSKSCSVTIITCTVDNIHETLDNKTTFIFTNAASENFTSIILNYIKLQRFPTEIFEQFPQLSHVEAKGGLWNDFPENPFQHAKHLIELNLDRNKINNLTNFRFDSENNLHSLHLARNSLKELPFDVFILLSKLEYLDLERNSIESLPPNIFDPLKNIKTLNLRFNKLKEIDPKAFIMNHELAFLDLDGLEIEALNLTLGQSHLLKLSLKFTKVETLALSTISTDPVSIDTLDMNGGAIRNLSSINIDNKISIRELVLMENGIENLEVIPKPSSNYTFGIKTLRLGYNNIKHFSRKFTQHFPGVIHLFLDRNDELDMTAGMFAEMKSLKSLTLAENLLESLDLEWFSGLPNLEMIDVSENHLTSVDYIGLKKAIPSLRTLSIDYNHFSCDYLRELFANLKDDPQLTIKKMDDIELYEGYHHSKVFGIFCEGRKRFENEFYWTGAVVVIIVALITGFLLLRTNFSKVCCGNESYEGMTTETNENVVTEETRSYQLP